MKIVRETGLINCILDGNTVILVFGNTDGSQTKRYHRYKTAEKAEHMWNSFKQASAHSCIWREEKA